MNLAPSSFSTLPYADRINQTYLFTYYGISILITLGCKLNIDQHLYIKLRDISKGPFKKGWALKVEFFFFLLAIIQIYGFLPRGIETHQVSRIQGTIFPENIKVLEDVNFGEFYKMYKIDLYCRESTNNRYWRFNNIL